MGARFWKTLHPRVEVHFGEDESDEEEEGGSNLFDPEAGKASDDPFAHLKSEDAPEDDSAASDKEVSKYVAGEEE